AFRRFSPVRHKKGRAATLVRSVRRVKGGCECIISPRSAPALIYVEIGLDPHAHPLECEEFERPPHQSLRKLIKLPPPSPRRRSSPVSGTRVRRHQSVRNCGERPT